MVPKNIMVNPTSSDKLILREMKNSDSERVLEIYKMGMDTKMATFETNIPTWGEFDNRHIKHSRFVIEIKNKISGWVALSPVSKRDAYKGVAEVSIYIDLEDIGKGFGSMLMEKVITSSESNGIWTIFSAIFPENQASVRLHKKFGFRIIGTRERISRIDGKWRDTIILERRSRKVGL
jgi:phosphinothricin acetyltransferase